MKPGTYGCVRSDSLIGWIIGHGTASPYAHSFVVVNDDRVLEARPGGVGYADLAKYVKAGAVFNDEEPMDDLLRARIVVEAIKLIDSAYDWAAIIDLGLRVLGEKSELLPVGQAGRYICSQYVTVSATQAGKIYCPDVDRWMVSPRTLADRITTRSWER